MASDKPPVPIVIAPDSGCESGKNPVQGLSDQSNDSQEESLDLNNVEVIDDLSVNRWLMRIMRLGASYVSTGSNGYRTGSISSSSSGSRSRRLSVTNDTSASNLLRPPNTSRGRRFSDSVNFDVSNLIAQSKQRKGVPQIILFHFTDFRYSKKNIVREHFFLVLGSVEQSNLMKMRNSNLGQSAPSLTASMVGLFFHIYFFVVDRLLDKNLSRIAAMNA